MGLNKRFLKCEITRFLGHLNSKVFELYINRINSNERSAINPSGGTQSEISLRPKIKKSKKLEMPYQDIVIDPHTSIRSQRCISNFLRKQTLPCR